MICPKCKSDNVTDMWDATQPYPTHYTCWVCNYKWSDNTKTNADSDE